MKKSKDNVTKITTDSGTVGVTKGGKFIPASNICQACGAVLAAHDYLEYSCNKCIAK